MKEAEACSALLNLRRDARGPLPAAPLVHDSADPLVVVGHLGVNAQLVPLAAALAPGHQARQEPGVAVQSDHWAAAVAFTGIDPLSEDAGAKHVVRDVVGHDLGADAAVHQWDPDDIERRAVLVAVVSAPAGHHHGGAVEVQNPLGHVTSRQADRDDVLGEGDGMLQAQQGDVVVHRSAVVVWVFEGLSHRHRDLSVLPPVTLIVTWRQMTC